MWYDTRNGVDKQQYHVGGWKNDQNVTVCLDFGIRRKASLEF